MSESRPDFETLARAFAAREQSRGIMNECPDPEQLYEAASGTLEREQRLRIVDHVSQCVECSQAWRMAMELGARPSGPVEQLRPTLFSRLHPPRWRVRAKAVEIRLALAAAAMCAIAVAAYLALPVQQQRPQYRDVANPLAPVSLLAENLTRERFMLRWSPGPQGSTYTLRLTTADLLPLLVQQDVTKPEFLVPSAVLGRVVSGEQLLWQVEVRLPNGERVTSKTYVVTLD